MNRVKKKGSLKIVKKREGAFTQCDQSLAV